MANKINVDVEITSNIDEQTRSAKILRKELESAKRISGDSSRAAGDTKAYAMAADAAASSTERLGYGIARAAAGTGAAGRDFAKQAQGLGGLVHVYATFAANLFAVGAAFTALKNAADTTSMIKGLDQLGAASGRGLGTLSKQIVSLTDGAVTLREAMEATAKATAAGMSSEDLKRLAVGAKNASQALGVDMSDALSRLSRGITKLEPELLDELGIFVRVDKAAADYARTLGKPASALTDFEKRAGFAAATLEQVEKKFGAIKLDSNPYNQLLASLKQVVQTGLEVVNSVLEPILRMLSSSPTALAAAMGLVGTALLKQAIPALGSMRESMRASAEEATKIANFKSAEAKRARILELNETKAAAENSAEIRLAATERAQKQIADAQVAGFKKSTKAYQILNMDWQDIEQKHFNELQKQADRFEKSNPEVSNRYKAAIVSLREYIDSEKNYLAVEKKVQEEMAKTHGLLSTQGQLQMAAERANQAASSRMIVSNAAYTASLNGPFNAWKKLNAEIAKARSGPQTIGIMLPQFDSSGAAILDEQGKQVTALENITTKKMGIMRAGWTRLTGAMAITTSALGNAVNAFGLYGAVIAALGAVMSVVIDKFSATSKESRLTSEALNNLSSASENAERVLVRLRDIDPLERFSVESIQARATALNELASAFGTSINRVYDELKKMNSLDKTVDFFKGLFNADIADNLADNLSEGIVYAFKLAGEGTASKQAEEAIRSILGDVDLKDENALKSALEPLIKGGPIAQLKVEEVNKAIKKLGMEAGTAAAKGTELKSAIDVTGKAFQDVATSFVPSDNISKLGLALLSEAAKFNAAIDEPQQKLLALKAVLESPVQMSLLPPEMRDNLAQYNEELVNLINASSIYDSAIESTNQELYKMQKLYDEVDKAGPWSGNETQLNDITNKINELTGTIDKYKDAKISIKADIEAKTGNFSDIGTQMFQKGAELIGNRLSAEFAKAAGVISKAAASLAPDTITGITLGTRADQAQLEVEKQMINVQMTLVKSMHDLQQATELSNLLKQKELEESKLFGKDQARIDALNNSITRLQKGIEASKGAGFAGSPGALKELAAQGVDQATITLATQLLSMKAELGGKSAQQAANAIAEQGKLIDQRTSSSLKELEAVKELDKLELDRLGNIKGVDGIISGELLKRKQSLELSTAQADADAKIIKAQSDVEKFQLMINSAKLQGNAKAQEELGTLQKVLETAKTNKQTTIDTLTAKQKYDQESNAIAREKQLLDLEIQRTSAISSLGILADTETVRLQAQLEMRNLLRQQTLDAKNLEIQLNQIIAQQEATKDEAKRSALQQTIDALRQQQTEEQAVYDKKIATLEVMNRVRIVQAQTNELATSLNAIFTGMNNTVGEFAATTIKAFESMNSSADAYAKKMAEIDAEKKKTAEDKSLPEDDRRKKLEDLAKDEASLKKKSIKDELTGNAAILGSAKKLFNEKSASYKILAGMEKAMHIAKLVMWGVEMAMSAKAALTEIMFGEAVQAQNATTATTNAGVAITNQGKGDPYSAFARIAAMVGVMAAVLAAFVGGGSGGAASVSVPSMPTADQLQEVQGTGQDYQAGTLNLLSNGGGVLGDIKAKSEDIANSIDYIESHTFETLVYNNKMLAALKGIEVNTSEFVASLAQAGIIGINSPFGTQNTSSGGGNPGFLGMFGSSSSTSREVTDFGVKIAGAMGDLAKGVGEYLVYETVKTVSSWSSSGFFGIGGGSGTSTSYSTEFRNLNDDVITTLRALFVNASDFILASGEVLGGRTQAELQNIIDRTEIKLDVSTFNLTGEEALADVMAEIGVEMNKLVYVAYPFLTEFQKLGEGLATTLARVTNDMQTVDVMFAQMGVNFAEKFLIPADDVIAQNRLADEKIATAQRKIQDARAAIEQKRLTGYVQQQADIGYNEWGEMVSVAIDRPLAAIYATTQDYITGLEQMSNMDVAYTGWWGSYGEDPNKVAARDAARATLADYYAALQEEADAMNNRKFDIPLANTRVYEDLINKFGGDVQTFIDKTQFYIDNFVDENTVLMAHYGAVGKELNRLQGIYPNVALSTVDTRQEFITLVNSLDLASESGRQLYVDLMNLAPGFDVIANHLEDLISKAGLAADDFTNTMMDAIKGNLANTDIGANVANTIYDGIMTTISQSYVENIGNLLVQHIVTPIISAASTGATIVGAVSTATIQNVRNAAVASAQMLSAIFNDAEFIDALKILSSEIGDLVQSFSDISASATNTGSALAASAKAMQDLVSKAGLASSNFGTVLKDAIAGNLAVSEIGTKVATMINDGILTAITDQFVNSIGEAITTNIITPLITAMTTGAALSSAVSASAIDSVRLAAGRAATAISTIFSDPVLLQTINSISTTIAQSMSTVAATTQVSAGSISKIITKTNAKIVDAYKKQASELTSTINRLKGFSDSLKDFRDSLLTGNLSPLTPLEKYNKALTDLNETYALAQAGDEDAMSRLKTVAQTFLDMSSEYYASSDAYATDFNRVQTILADAIGSLDSQVSVYQQQLDAANAQLNRLGSIDDTAKSIEELLREAQAIQREEIANILSGGFVGLDRNLDGLLNIDELKAANLASDSELAQVYQMLDSNGDGQISALEALQGSTEGTTYSVNSLAPLLSRIYDGTLSVEDAVRYLAQINQANVAAGGSALDVDFRRYLPGTGTGGSGTGYSGALNQVYETLGLTKDAAGMSYWANQMLEGKVTTETLLQSVLNAALGNDDPNALRWVQQYVESAYQTVLGREGEAGGINYWVSSIKAGNVKINDLYQTFSKSEEAINKGVTNLDDYITRAYEVVLGRRPDPAGLAAWKSQIETGQMYIGDLYAAFRSSSEYINLIRDQIFGMGSNINNNTVTGSPSSGTNFSSTVSSAVNSAYSTILGRQADAGGAEWWRSQVLSGGLSLNDLNMSLARTAAAQQTTTDAYAAIQWLRSQGVPGFASGGYHMGGVRLVGENGPELESTGEARIWTAQQTRNMLSGVASRNSQNGDLVAEIQRLNDKIDSLERTVQQGDLMNAQATERNTQQVSGTIKDTTSKATYTNRLQTRAAIA